MVIEKLCDLTQSIEIFHHLFANVRALHFHRYRPAIAQMSKMYLPERSRRNRLRFEIRKCFRYSDSELRGHDLLDLSETKRFDLILQTGKRVEIRTRQQFHAGGEQLSELNKGWAEFLQIRGQLVGLGRFLRPKEFFSGQRFLKARFFYQVGTSVFR